MGICTQLKTSKQSLPNFQEDIKLNCVTMAKTKLQFFFFHKYLELHTHMCIYISCVFVYYNYVNNDPQLPCQTSLFPFKVY